ncbi:ABC-2 type transport system permease protein [Tindallia magadiensis]|uniref:ABC-2 type transport system permease protein n=1 Tax=Tindallia magadiensis TaxID=69895 RepID=A0A1I3D6Y4_9FIRM|nr:DUF6449 domain-containing protein [Tindallia magadiensis]SFH82473.1 ABC-2 type transport system permease protein [Tindallia magadiensis]
MKWIKSFLHKGVMATNLKRFVWVGGTYFILLMLLLPLRVLMTLPSVENYYFNDQIFTRMYAFQGEPFQMFLILTVPFVTAIVMFQYLQQKSPTDFFHSIPLPRKTLFWSNLTSGALLWSVPILATGGISFLIRSFTELHLYLESAMIWQWMGTSLLMNAVIYCVSITVGMFSGVILAQGIFTYILLLLPAGMLVLIAYNLNSLLHGFSGDFLMREEYLLFSPVIRTFGLYADMLTRSEVQGYLVACIILIALSRVLYQYRRMERCRQTVVFNGINMIFLMGITFCVMLTGGLYIQLASRHNGIWVFVAYLLFALLGHFIALAVLNKSFRVFNRKSAKSFGIYLLVVGAILGGIVTDITGYEQRVPDPEKVEAAYFDWGFWRYHHKWDDLDEEGMDYLYRQPESIEKIVALHERIVQQKKGRFLRHHSYNGDLRGISLVYHLENGNRQIREYTVPYEEYESYFRPIRELAEDKMMEYPVLRLKPEDVSHIEFRSSELDKRKILQQEEAREVLEIIQQEIKEADYDVLYGEGSHRQQGSLRVRLTDGKSKAMAPYYGGEVYVVRHPEFETLEAWLKDQGYYEDVTVVPEDIHQVSVQMVQNEEEWELMDRNGFMEVGNGITTKEKEEIKESLTRYDPFWRRDDHFPVYVVGFFDEFDNQLFMGTFESGNLPEFIYLQ